MAIDNNEMEFAGWGLIGEPQEGMIVETGNGMGIGVTGYNVEDYWSGVGKFLGPDIFGVVPVYRLADGSLFPPDAVQYPYNS
jgi:hypothetical protein